MSKIIYNSIIPFGNFYAINIFGIIFAKDKRKKMSKAVLNHEEIHTAQMKELGYVFFYILYFIEWVYRLCTTKDAYWHISFEREAYDNQDDYKYLTYRKKYNFVKYLKNPYERK